MCQNEIPQKTHSAKLTEMGDIRAIAMKKVSHKLR